MDTAGGAALAPLAQLQKDLASAADSRPTTLAAVRLCLDRLATSAENLVRSFDADPEGQLRWWAQSLFRQCRDVIDELTFLTPWTLLPASLGSLGEFQGIGEIPTLRQLARLEVDLLPAIDTKLASAATPEERAWLDQLRRLITKASQRAGARMAAIEGLARQSSELCPHGV